MAPQFNSQLVPNKTLKERGQAMQAIGIQISLYALLDAFQCLRSETHNLLTIALTAFFILGATLLIFKGYQLYKTGKRGLPKGVEAKPEAKPLTLTRILFSLTLTVIIALSLTRLIAPHLFGGTEILHTNLPELISAITNAILGSILLYYTYPRYQNPLAKPTFAFITLTIAIIPPSLLGIVSSKAASIKMGENNQTINNSPKPSQLLQLKSHWYQIELPDTNQKNSKTLLFCKNPFEKDPFENGKQNLVFLLQTKNLRNLPPLTDPQKKTLLLQSVAPWLKSKNPENLTIQEAPTLTEGYLAAESQFEVQEGGTIYSRELYAFFHDNELLILGFKTQKSEAERYKEEITSIVQNLRSP